jgi:putative ABC transport system ATP-binding protein
MAPSPLNGSDHELPTVRLTDVSFAWPGQKPLIEIDNLTIEAGETVFIAGPSGCGKSTLLNLIGGLMRPQRGEIFLAEKNLTALSGPARDRLRGERMGFIFQQFNLLPYLTVLDNVTLPARLSTFKRKRAEKAFGSFETAAKELLTRLDLSENLWTRPVTTLSVGQQQRVAAARALLGQPPLIMADEPTSALDIEHRKSFVDLLLTQSQKEGISVLFVSHDRSLSSLFKRNLDFVSFFQKPIVLDQGEEVR